MPPLELTHGYIQQLTQQLHDFPEAQLHGAVNSHLACEEAPELVWLSQQRLEAEVGSEELPQRHCSGNPALSCSL